MQTTQPIITRQVQPAADRDMASQRPTEIRYGWCPYGDINLAGPDGTISLYVQPHEIEEGGVNIPNPYHRVLPKGQLIPFPTFNAIEQMPSPDIVDSTGRPMLITSTRAMTALDAATMVLRTYSIWGFKILDSLQGLDQDMAFRIFQVVQPLDYPMGRLLNELSFGAQQRIDATDIITFAEFSGYEVEPLRSDFEREKAEALALEMEAGADIAVTLATETLDFTEASMTQKFSGGHGKTGADALDKRLSADMGRDLPKFIGNNKATDLAEMKDQMDFLVSREASRADKEEIATLKAKIAAMEAGISVDTMKAETSTCGAPTNAGGICNTNTKPGERCRHHKDEVVTA